MIPVLVLLLAFAAFPSWAQHPHLSASDRIRLAEAFSLSHDIQERVWPGWSKAPFAILLVTPDDEFLIRHPEPSDDFVSLGYDSLLASDVYTRPRTYSTALLATFPAVGGIPTVVIGRPEDTGKSSTFWVLTVLHEHFHQLQNSHPRYWDAVSGLDLAGGDESGMWMLNYPFPYDSTVVVDRFEAYRDALCEALRSVGSDNQEALVGQFVAARLELRNVLKDADYRYLSFQLWQEGVARFIELRLATAASAAHRPLPTFMTLDDYVPYDVAADSLSESLLTRLGNVDLAEAKRLAFYPIGAAEALLLDVVAPDWKSRYFAELFDLGRLGGWR